MAYLDSELLKPSDLAAYLQVSRSWVYEAAKAGRIPCVRLGGADGPLRFVASDIEDWLENARHDWLPGRRSPPASPQLRLDGLAGTSGRA